MYLQVSPRWPEPVSPRPLDRKTKQKTLTPLDWRCSGARNRSHPHGFAPGRMDCLRQPKQTPRGESTCVRRWEENHLKKCFTPNFFENFSEKHRIDLKAPIVFWGGFKMLANYYNKLTRGSGWKTLRSMPPAFFQTMEVFLFFWNQRSRPGCNDGIFWQSGHQPQTSWPFPGKPEKNTRKFAWSSGMSMVLSKWIITPI